MSQNINGHSGVLQFTSLYGWIILFKSNMYLNVL